MIRRAFAAERARIADALEPLQVPPPEAWLEGSPGEIWIADEEPRTVLLVPAGLARRFGAESGPAPDAAGLPLGKLDRDAFQLGLEGAYEAARHAARGTVRVNAKAAQLFLYGRDVLGESILDRVGRVEAGQTVIVLNARGEALGLARAVRTLPARGRALKPVLDRGWYLRAGG